MAASSDSVHPPLCLLDHFPTGYVSLSVLNELLRVLRGWIIVNDLNTGGFERCTVKVHRIPYSSNPDVLPLPLRSYLFASSSTDCQLMDNQSNWNKKRASQGRWKHVRSAIVRNPLHFDTRSTSQGWWKHVERVAVP